MSKNNMQTRFVTWLKGNYRGQDDHGNRYFEEKALYSRSKLLPKRWVIYSKEVEASCVPAIWHGWLHYTHPHPLENSKTYNWIKPHSENLTGTHQAYYPPGHLIYPQLAKKTIKRYEPWKP